MGIGCSCRGLTAIILPQSTPDKASSLLGREFLSRRQDNYSLQKQIIEFRNYLAGKRVLFTCQLDLTGSTPFQRLVWLKTREIPYGDSRSYAWLASAINNPKASRAVGQALGRNPLPIVIPCHRVLASDGTLGGFSGGLDIKRRLLRLEGIIGQQENSPDGEISA